MNFVGIDYSMSSPSVCIHQGAAGGGWSINNCVFHYIVKRDKHLVVTNQIKGSLYKEYEHQQERFNNLSDWVLQILDSVETEITHISIEGYSYGSSSSRLFEIGENTGLLKYKLWEKSYPFAVYPPTTIKKFATGKGNSPKDKMWESFIGDTGLNIFNILGQEEGKNWNPVSDMVDAYYLTKYGFEQKSLDNHQKQV